ncbi:MAG: hypothetical protein AAFX02_01760 [Pseudomonadota bacterium]
MSDLTKAEMMAVHMFTRVSLQCSFALEDPNIRFIEEFKMQEGVGTKSAPDAQSVPNKTYKAELEGIPVTLETNPPNMPALSRVLLDKGRAAPVLQAVRDAYKDLDYFEEGGEGTLPPALGIAPDPGMKNKLIYLITTGKYELEHDIAMLMSWVEGDEQRQQVELAAWPIKKQMHAAKEQS